MTGRGRRAARSASHEQASSPPAATLPHAGTASRSTRVTRAQSQEIDAVNNKLPAALSKRTVRQTSVDSTGSVNSRASRTTRNQNQATVMDLTTVEEAHESELVEDDADGSDNLQDNNEVDPGSSIRTLYKGRASVHTMMGSSQIPPSGQITTGSQTTHNKALKSIESTAPLAKSTVETHSDSAESSRPEDDNEAGIANSGGFPQHMMKVFQKKSNEVNKENRQPAKKRTLLDRQDTAHRVEWNEDDSQELPAILKRKQQQSMEEEQSDDQYEVDERPARAQQAQQTTKRTKIVEQDPIAIKLALQRNAERRHQEQELQASARANDGEEEEEDEQEQPEPTYTQIRQASKWVTKHRVAPKTQQRVPWSVAETETLIELIGEYGSNWASIEKIGDFHENRGQVGLKDKARNMKVDYLKTGATLPTGFDYVNLGKKEIDKVKATGMNPYRREGEEVGQERFDEDGNDMA